MERILVAFDGSQHAIRAAQTAAEFARCLDTSLTVLHVVEHRGSRTVPRGLDEFERLEHIRITERDLLESAAKRIAAQGAEVAEDQGADDVQWLVRDGDPGRTIAAVAEEIDADLVVLGRRGLSDVAGVFLGSVSHKVSHDLDRAVLTVR